MKAFFSNGWVGAKDNITIEGKKKLLAPLAKNISTYLNHISELRPVYKSDLRKTATLYHETILPSFHSVRDACIRLREINQEAMYKASEQARRMAKRAIWSMVIIGGTAIGIGLGFSLFLSNLLVRPV